MKKAALFYLIFSILFLIAAIFVRYDLVIHVPVEYDEVFTQRAYTSAPAWRILNEIETPNNHPIHSILCSVLPLPKNGDFSRLIRLPSFLFGLLLLIGGAAFLWIRYRSLSAVWMFLAGVGFSGILTYYSAIARGYSIQAFFVLALYFLLFCLPKKPERKWIMPIAAGVFIAALGTCFSITSGAMYCGAAGLAFLLTRINCHDLKKSLSEEKHIIIAGLLAAVIAGIWLFAHRTDIQTAQQFGEPLNSIASITDFWVTTISGLLILPQLAVCAIGSFAPKQGKYKSEAQAAVLISLIVLLCAFATKAGPVRVYITLIPVTTAAAALVISDWAALYAADNERRIRGIGLVILILCLLPLVWMPERLEKQKATDWSGAVAALEQTERYVYPVFPVWDTLVLRSVYPEFFKSTVTRLMNQLHGIVVCNAEPGIFPVSDFKGERTPNLSVNAKPLVTMPVSPKMQGHLYRLKQITDKDNLQGKTIVIQIFRPKKISISNPFVNEKNVYLTDMFFHNTPMTVNGETVITGLFLVQEPQNPASYYLEFAKKFPGFFRCYLLD